MNTQEKIKAIQSVLNVEPDGIWGPRSQGALNVLVSNRPIQYSVLASSFADPTDVAAFRKCKAQGKSDQECFKVGDNGVGCWGDDTTADKPMCALPREDWIAFGAAARGRKVLVSAAGNEVVCELRDTMPWKRNIKNGAGIDLNPAAGKALGLKPPFLVRATWQWVEKPLAD